VVVAGSRLNRTAGSAQVINKKQLERFEYDDPHRVLLQVPGVYIRQEDGVGLRPNIGIRGGNPDRSKKVTLMEDGILFGPAPYSAPAAYYFPLTTRMTQVRVVKGPSAIAYGPQTVGGAIDFVTRPIPSQTSGGADLAFGQYGYDKVNAYFGTSAEQFGFLFEYLRIHNTGFKELPDEDADTGSTRTEWMAKGSYVLDPSAANRNEFGLKLTYSEEKSNETYLGLTDADFRDDPYQRYAASALDEMKNHRIGFVLSHQLDLPASHLKLTTAAYRHDYHRIWRKLNRFGGAQLFPVLDAPDDAGNAELVRVLRGEEDSVTGSDSLFIGPNDRTFVSQGLQSVLDLGAATGPLSHSIQAGVRLHYDSIERRHSEDEFLMTNGELVPAGTGTIVTTANLERTYALALHALDAVTWGDLTLTPGARLELIHSESEDRKTGGDSDAFTVAVMPGVGAYYGFTDWAGALAGVYRGFSPPPPGDEAVKPEYSVNYEAGGRLSDGPHRLEVIGFFNDYSNLTDICTFSSSCEDSMLDEQFSAGEAHIWGLEAYAAYEVDAGPVKVPFTAAYTLTDSEFLDTFDSADPIYGSVEKGDELPYIPRHQASVTLGLDSEYAGAAVAGYYVSPMREEAGDAPVDESLATDEQTWMDISAYVKPLKVLSVYANLRNVTGSRDIVGRRPFGARPNAPRWLQVGAKLAF
jgi:Fe(3+) dicitrate transport protein